MKREEKIKVGSLFDGIGGTPLSAVLSGAEPVWASEIEEVPMSITKRHFPNMKHYGDITQINGAEIEPVDIIVGGSPCQDLSLAGKRAGLEGERSGLFMDQMRIVKEMRNATKKQTRNGSDELPRPRYMVWENVLGAFSSNKGEDFRAVLEEVCKVCDPEARVPRPPKGKWVQGSGSILGDGYSVAWRTVDAQYWGVPQRRRRIYLVADFGGHTAPEICFERESVSGDIEASGEARKGVARNVEGGVTTAGGKRVTSTITATYGTKWNGNSGAYTGDHFILDKKAAKGVAEDTERSSGGSGAGGGAYRHVVCYNGENVTSPTNAQNPKPGDPCHTLGTDSRNYVCYGFASRQQSMTVTEDCVNPILSTDYKEPQVVCYPINTMAATRPEGSAQNRQTFGVGADGDPLPTITSAHHHAVCYGLDTYNQGTGDNNHKTYDVRFTSEGTVNARSNVYESDTARTIDTSGNKPDSNQGGIAVVAPIPVLNEQGASLKASGGTYEGGSENYAVQGMAGNDQAATLLASYASKQGLDNQHVDQGCPNFIHQPVYAIDRESFSCGQNYARKLGITEDGINSTLLARGPSAVASPEQKYTIRRLTPLECERLQGFPDEWTALDHENKPVSDTQRYKALGNSFAVPNAYFFISRCVKQLRIEMTLEEKIKKLEEEVEE